MDFQIAGNKYFIDREQILEVTEGVEPSVADSRNKHFVRLHGRAYPIKQVVHLATGLPHIAFTAQHAHRILSASGFDVYQPTRPPSDLNLDNALAASSGAERVRLPVVLETDEDGYVVASCPTLVGCHSQGRTREEAISNIKEAIRGYIASMRKHGERLPSSSRVEEVEVAL